MLPRTPLRAGTTLLALALTFLLALTAGQVAADTETTVDAPGPRGAHDVVRVRVDNTGPRTGVVVRHKGSDWRGRIELSLDTRRGPRSEYVATLRHSDHPRPIFTDADGSRWPCAGRVAVSPSDTVRTRLALPRECLDGATKLRVLVRVTSPHQRTDRARSGVVLQQSRPNIVMLMVDDMRQDDLAYMPLTRELIGAQGVTFANSFAPYPLCCPARASVLTGQYAHNHRVWSHKPPWGFNAFEDESTVATWLQDAGYATTYLGKYLNGYGNQPVPGAETGTSVRYVPPGWDDWRGSIDGGLPKDHPQNGGTYRYFDTTLSDNGHSFDGYDGQYQTRVYGRLTERIIKRRARSDRPFFSYVSYTAPHHGTPRDPDDPRPVLRDDGATTHMKTPPVPADVRGVFDDVITEAPGASWSDPDPSDKPEELRDVPPPNDAEKAAMLEATRQRAEALSVVDNQVADTIAALEATGELEETLVVFTSDNGYFLGEQGIRQGKILPYEPALRTPLLIRGPGIPRGEVRTDPFLSIDFAPTFADLADVTPPTPVDGVSMLEVAREGDDGWDRIVLTETGPAGVVRDTDESGERIVTDDPGVRDIRYVIGIRTNRYLYTDRATGEEELYDLVLDPEQYHNVVDRPGYRHTSDLMREQLRRVRACDAAECQVSLPDELATTPTG